MTFGQRVISYRIVHRNFTTTQYRTTGVKCGSYDNYRLQIDVRRLLVSRESPLLSQVKLLLDLRDTMNRFKSNRIIRIHVTANKTILGNEEIPLVDIFLGEKSD